METLYAICVGAITTGGVFLVMRGYTFAVVLGSLANRLLGRS